jgi:hypothetical protein
MFYTFHAAFNVICLMDWLPLIDLDTAHLLKFDYLQNTIMASVLLLNIELRFFFLFCLPTFLALEYWRGFLHLEYGVWTTQVNLHLMRVATRLIILAIYCYRT